MAEIRTSVMINSTQEKIWDVISDIDNEPKFWKGTKEVRNISKDGKNISREITIAFRDQKCLQNVTITPKEMIRAVFTEGVIVGEKILTLKNNGDSCELEAIWDVKLSGMMGMFTGMIKKHIKSGTEQALQAIKKEVENYLNIFSGYPYIFNLGHGVLPETKPETIKHVTNLVRKKNERKSS